MSVRQPRDSILVAADLDTVLTHLCSADGLIPNEFAVGSRVSLNATMMSTISRFIPSSIVFFPPGLTCVLASRSRSSFSFVSMNKIALRVIDSDA